jgi:hypothetical protein
MEKGIIGLILSLAVSFSSGGGAPSLDVPVTVESTGRFKVE